jgi:hypothetical protein
MILYISIIGLAPSLLVTLDGVKLLRGIRLHLHPQTESSALVCGGPSASSPALYSLHWAAPLFEAIGPRGTWCGA